MACGGAAPGESAQYHVGHGPADHGFGVCRVTFVVASQAAAHGDPDESVLYRPTLRLDLEAPLAGVLADDLQSAVQDGGGPVDESAGEALVGRAAGGTGLHGDADRFANQQLSRNLARTTVEGRENTGKTFTA